MKNTGLKEYNDFRVGQLLNERIGNTNKHKLVLCKGIYVDESGLFYAGFQYVDKKSTKKNKKVTVSGKSPLWFEKI